MNISKAALFNALHVKGSPLVLYNAWDAGSAKIIEKSGAKALATSSWSTASAQGYEDGEQIPLEIVLMNVKRIVSVVDVPVTLDFEAGYAQTLDQLNENIHKVIKAGVVGINFEDQIFSSTSLYSINEQCDRIKTLSQAANKLSMPLCINARCDIFFKNEPSLDNENQLNQAIERLRAYAHAGCDGFFVPGLSKLEYIKTLCEFITYTN